jgi:predicted nicotinamide N-methyase
MKDFILTQTLLTAPAFIPEIRLHLATEVTPLWQATEDTLREINIQPPYWAFAWPGGQALARYLLDQPSVVQGRRVLDFAAGSGLVGIAAHIAGAAAVWANDIDPFCLEALALNAAANNAPLTILGQDLIGQPLPPIDLLIAGDIFYDRRMTDHIFPWLQTIAGQGVEVLLADPGRAYLPKTGLTPLARFTVPTSLDLEDRAERETVVYRLEGEGGTPLA